MKKHLEMFLELGKARIALVATATMVAGYVLARGAVTWTLFWVTLGVFFLASGASGLNQVQERGIDVLMERTRDRPLPSRRLSLAWAIGASVLSIVSGALIVLGASNPTAVALGLAAVGWYNGVYTPLKRATAFAAVPGGLVGAIPPAIGWTAGGGRLLDPTILAVSFFFFMWQVPHFWLLLLSSCGRDYEIAGLPSMTRTFSRAQVSRITFAWIAATATVCVLIPLCGRIEQAWIITAFFFAGVWIVWRAARVLREGTPAAFRAVFGQINAYAVCVISLLLASGLLR